MSYHFEDNLVDLRIPSLKITIKVPTKLSRVVFCLNYNGFYTDSAILNENLYKIILKDGDRFKNWLEKINISENPKHIQFRNVTRECNVIFGLYFGDEKTLSMSVLCPHTHVKEFDNALYHALRTK